MNRSKRGHASGMSSISSVVRRLRSDFVMPKSPLQTPDPYTLIAGLGIANPEDIPYYAEVGRFIVQYAKAEAAVHILARKLTGLNDDPARIIFSGMRLDDLATRVRGLMRISTANAHIFHDVDACLTQLDVISKQRSKLVHRHVEYADGAMQVTNAFIAKSLENVEKDVFTPEDLTAMMTDCGTINLRLLLASGLTWNLGDEVREVLYWPWRYTPPRPTPQAKLPRKEKKSHLRRRRASQR
jgi:hypothetical protein